MWLGVKNALLYFLMNELLRASREGDEIEAKRLLDYGADVHSRNQYQRTPLHHAENEAIAKLLLNHGADVNARDQWQDTPLHLAGNVAIARLLVNRGAQLTAVDQNGQNFLHLAAEYAKLDLCLFLTASRV